METPHPSPDNAPTTTPPHGEGSEAIEAELDLRTQLQSVQQRLIENESKTGESNLSNEELEAAAGEVSELVDQIAEEENWGRGSDEIRKLMTHQRKRTISQRFGLPLDAAESLTELDEASRPHISSLLASHFDNAINSSDKFTDKKTRFNEIQEAERAANVQSELEGGWDEGKRQKVGQKIFQALRENVIDYHPEIDTEEPFVDEAAGSQRKRDRIAGVASRLALMNGKEEKKIEENQRERSLEARRSSAEVAALNDRAEIEIYGSKVRTAADPNETDSSTGEPKIIAGSINQQPGKIEDIRANPKYGKTETEREARANQYEQDVQELLDEGYELSQAKLIMDMRQEDQKFITTMARNLVDSHEMPVDEAIARAKAIYEKKEAKRLKAIKELGIFSAEEYAGIFGEGPRKATREDNAEGIENEDTAEEEGSEKDDNGAEKENSKEKLSKAMDEFTEWATQFNGGRTIAGAEDGYFDRMGEGMNNRKLAEAKFRSIVHRMREAAGGPEKLKEILDAELGQAREIATMHAETRRLKEDARFEENFVDTMGHRSDGANQSEWMPGWVRRLGLSPWAGSKHPVARVKAEVGEAFNRYQARPDQLRDRRDELLEEIEDSTPANTDGDPLSPPEDALKRALDVFKDLRERVERNDVSLDTDSYVVTIERALKLIEEFPEFEAPDGNGGSEEIDLVMTNFDRAKIQELHYRNAAREFRDKTHAIDDPDKREATIRKQLGSVNEIRLRTSVLKAVVRADSKFDDFGALDEEVDSIVADLSRPLNPDAKKEKDKDIKIQQLDEATLKILTKRVVSKLVGDKVGNRRISNISDEEAAAHSEQLQNRAEERRQELVKQFEDVRYSRTRAIGAYATNQALRPVRAAQRRFGSNEGN